MLKLVSLCSENFDDFAKLLSGDEFGGCFCAVWTSFDEAWEKRCADPSLPNLQITKERISLGEHVGYLVYDEESIVAWTGAGPKTDFRLLQTKLASRLSRFEADIWCIGCLAIGKHHRGKGLARLIVQRVLEKAHQHGADCVEAYPVKPWDKPRSYRGHFQTYLNLGFSVVDSERDGDSEILLMQYIL